MSYYKTDVPDTASELFDRELVIAHYGSGLYYSISPSGSAIWSGLRHGLSPVEVSEWLAGHLAIDVGTIAGPVDAFVEKLVAEGLVIEVPAPVDLGELPAVAIENWSEPVLERFDDLQELLTLDPVHDVSDAGWPHRPDDAA